MRKSSAIFAEGFYMYKEKFLMFFFVLIIKVKYFHISNKCIWNIVFLTGICYIYFEEI